MISRRVQNIQESKTVSLSNLVSTLSKKGRKIINFGIGEPDFTTPEHITRYSMEMALKGFTHYTPSAGIPELREKVAEIFSRKVNKRTNAENVMITPTKFSINLALGSLIDPGDEVIIGDPAYLSYPEIVKLQSGKPVLIENEDNYDYDFEKIEQIITPRTKAIIFCNPSNPTGKVYSRDQVSRMVKFARDHDIYLISDEIYEDIIFEGQMHNAASFESDYDKVITMGGFSKSYAMTGWRIGYMIASPEIINACNKIQQQTITCASSVSQYAALKALDDAETPARFCKIFKSRRDLVMQLLSEIDGLHARKPEGTFYVFPGYDPDIDSVEFSRKLLEENNVAVTPGSAFGPSGERHFRISFATDDNSIKEGISAIGQFMKRLGN
ncbi:MAG: pyridoxal phosphate-dependent aminotransferase [Thermoplasmataceae archaeon]